MDVAGSGETRTHSQGARFWAVDLHVHTPASRDVDTKLYGTEDPVEIVHAAIAAGLDAIAVTDHNTADWCERVAKAASGTNLTVLPGVEVSTTEGHLLGIWEVDTGATVINDLLARLGIDSSRRGQMDATSSFGFEDAAREIVGSGGVAIPAHIDKEKGLLRLPVPTYVNKLLASQYFAGLDIVDKEQIQAVQRKVGEHRRLSFVRTSDCGVSGAPGHRLDGIGQRRTWIKATQPDLIGLRHALDDPDLRVSLSEPPKSSQPYVKSLRFSGGFLDGTVLDFSPELNCLLGGTGAGKSLVLEAIRFCLDQQADKVHFKAIREEVDSRLQGALQDGSTVHLSIVGPFGERQVSRTQTLGTASRPTVSRLVDGELVPTGESPRDLMPIHAFSQGEALGFARSTVGRMSLVDGSIDFGNLDDKESDVLEKLKLNDSALVSQMQVVSRLEDSLTEETIVAEQLQEISKVFDGALVEQQQKWTAEEASLTGVIQSIKQLPLGEWKRETGEVKSAIEENADIAQQAERLIRDLYRELDRLTGESRALRDETVRQLEALKSSWSERFSLFTQDLNAQLGKVGDGQTLSSLRDSLQALQAKSADLGEMRERLEDSEQPKLNRVIEQRESLVRELGEIRSSKRQLRRTKIAELNRLTTGVVKLDLPNEADVSLFRKSLEALKTGSNIRGDAFFQSVSTRIHPFRLVRCIAYGKLEELVIEEESISLTDLTKYRDNILMKDLLPQLLEMQYCPMPDQLTMKFKKLSTGEYSRIEHLAHGEKCTAILVTLLADGDSPVVVDQPEDALHAPWIEEFLVERLRNLRGNRQCIFATRSPGIVIGADAEQIITLEATATKGKIEARGSLERHDLNKLALLHLEGGPIAFQRRSRKLKPSIGV